MHVLIVDDEPLSRTAFADVLSRRIDIEHFDVACDAPQALDRMRLRKYDVLLLDIHMPDISGLELVELLAELRIVHGGRKDQQRVVTAAHGAQRVGMLRAFIPGIVRVRCARTQTGVDISRTGKSRQQPSAGRMQIQTP